jgi:hypothetical protein
MRVSDNDTNPAEAALDLLLYAPLGLALEARELLPKLVERGKQQVTVARMMGQFAVQQGQALAGDRLGQAQKQAVETLAALGLWPKPASSTQAPLVGEPVTATTSPADTPAEPAEPAPAASSLAIPDYDSLSASQVVPRLDGLSEAELETVRRYESAKRGRKTILGKIGQLQRA